MFKHITQDTILQKDHHNCQCTIFTKSNNAKFFKQSKNQQQKRLRNLSLNLSDNKKKISISTVKKLKDSKHTNTTLNETEHQQFSRNQKLVTLVQTIPSTVIIPKITTFTQQPRLMFRTQRSPLSFKIENPRLPQCNSNLNNKSYFCISSIQQTGNINTFNHKQEIKNQPQVKQNQNNMLFSFNPNSANIKNENSVIYSSVNQQIKNITQASSTQQSQVYSYHPQLPLSSNIFKAKQITQIVHPIQKEDSPEGFGFRRIESYQQCDKSQDEVSVVMKHYPVSRLKSPFRPNNQTLNSNKRITRMSELSNMFDRQSTRQYNHYQ